MVNDNNKRAFPRIETQCPVLYRHKRHTRWMVGIMLDMSATGLKMQCKENLEPGTLIKIEYKPGKNKMVPEIRAKGKVVRSRQADGDKYEISCSLSNIQF